ncbi:hypothetical protein NQ317_007278 [Molorchus minor]|uniref:Uncharacterized protein n=1 Tax=Molorchus minor TaxID=1323400 RepID=A0ABQ9JU95_9CUCU|nr:hypothetical protein NQ317_007278 [Molorchus minor]
MNSGPLIVVYVTSPESGLLLDEWANCRASRRRVLQACESNRPETCTKTVCALVTDASDVFLWVFVKNSDRLLLWVLVFESVGFRFFFLHNHRKGGSNLQKP